MFLHEHYYLMLSLMTWTMEQIVSSSSQKTSNWGKWLIQLGRSQGCHARGLRQLEEGAERNLSTFSKGKHKVLYLRQTTFMQPCNLAIKDRGAGKHKSGVSVTMTNWDNTGSLYKAGLHCLLFFSGLFLSAPCL